MTWTQRFWIVAIALALALPALALDLDEARAKGVIGERADGYVAAVKDSPSDEVKRVVEEVNAKRRAYYAEIAQRNGAPVEAVAALAGQKLLASLPAGQWLNDGSGWKKK
ncbi:MAG TPA: YdbL family protein [Myxococcota bacterium]|jgi:hypothetical protein